MSSYEATPYEEDKETSDVDLFTPEFKRLKARRPPPNFSEVIDVNNIDSKTWPHKIERIELSKTDVKPVVGIKPCEDWNVFRFPDFPGYIVIQNPFLEGYQRYWVSRCLQDFSADRQNSSNLTNLGHQDYYGVWQDFVSRSCTTFDKDDPLRKLRWVTLGYHYGWDVKEYSEERKAEFPSDVQCLSQYFSHCLGFGAFRAEAGIVNYYHLDSTLGGHTDHSEIDHTAPLLSFSFGQKCVFLLGGPTKETKPMALFLHSGDVCIMSEQARLAYHAVPKIVAPPKDSCLPPGFSLPVPNTNNDAVITTNGDNNETEKSDSNSNQEKDGNIGNSSDNHLNQRQSSNSKVTSSNSINIINNCSIIGNSNTTNSGTTDNKIKIQSETMSEEYTANIDNLNTNIEKVISDLDWKPYETFLQHARINMNLRQVLPPEIEAVEPQMKKKVAVT